ncbi:MAG: glutathione S-transferase family protein [Gammaproteobacteria bacterium]
MKLYDCTAAPSPRRVRIFIAEKGMQIPFEQVDLANGQHLSPEYQAINPLCTVPALELDDGTHIIETSAICRYLESVQPDPPLFGVDAKDQARVTQWYMRVENDGFLAVAESFRNKVGGLKGRALTGPHGYAQIPELVERGRLRAERFFTVLDERLADNPFVAGERFSAADINAMVAVDFAERAKFDVKSKHANLRRWHETVAARPSARA